MEWLRAARRAADATPLRPRSPLRAVVADLGAVEIGSIETPLAERLLAAGLPLHGAEGAWTVVAPLDASLERIARRLHLDGVCPHWRGELLAISDGEGRFVGVVERAAVRALGITTFAVHLVGAAPDGRVWVQQRARTKSTDPGRWDTLMGGQVAAGESVVATLERETMEEAGLAVADLQDVQRCGGVTVRRPSADGYMVEHIAIFRAVVPEDLVPENRDGEVERFECLHEDALVERLRAGAFTLEATLILGAEMERRGRG